MNTDGSTESTESLILKEVIEIRQLFADISKSNSEFKSEIEGLREENIHLKSDLETILKESKERNVIIRGLPDSATETGQLLLKSVKNLIFKITKKKGIKIDTVKRLGQFELGFIRQVRVCFGTIKERNMVFDFRKNAEPTYTIDIDTVSQNLSDIDEGFVVDAYGLKISKRYELSKKDIKIDNEAKLGISKFCTTFKGTVNGIQAAIKVHSVLDKYEAILLLKDISVSSDLGAHQNVLGFIGAYLKEVAKGKLIFAYELCTNGSLLEFLVHKTSVVNSPNGTPISTEVDKLIDFYDLVRFALEIANAMEYIEMKVVHGNVALRNVYLYSNLTCKLGGFEKSRRRNLYQTYTKSSQESMPYRWMAYETLVRMEYSAKSDMWSFGVAAWEIFSLGAAPYKKQNWTPSFAEDLRNGTRLPKPKFASMEMCVNNWASYMKLRECWHLDGELRPGATEVVEFFTKVGNRARSTADYVYF